MRKLFSFLALSFLLVGTASAQAPLTTKPNINRLSTTDCLVTQFLLGGGADIALVCSGAMTSGQIMIGQAGTAPLPTSITGAIGINNGGVSTIANGAVANAALANMATSTVKGNFSGGTAAPSDASVPSCSNDGAHALTNNAGSGFNCANITGATATAPTQQTFTTGTNATYTTPANVKWIEVYMTGGGGGSAGSGANPGTPTAGGDTCWKASGTACTTPLYQASGGQPGTTNTTNPAAGGAGGGTAGSSTCNLSIPGGPGGAGQNSPNAIGGHGGSSWLGGGGAGGLNSGTLPTANSGGGGGGSGANNTAIISGAGGGGGGSCYFIIGSPAATYVYTVGTNGAGGTLGTGGLAGVNAAAGKITVIEHYNF